MPATVRRTSQRGLVNALNLRNFNGNHPSHCPPPSNPCNVYLYLASNRNGCSREIFSLNSMVVSLVPYAHGQWSVIACTRVAAVNCSGYIFQGKKIPCRSCVYMCIKPFCFHYHSAELMGSRAASYRCFSLWFEKFAATKWCCVMCMLIDSESLVEFAFVCKHCIDDGD